jgi:hypothetical protein
LEIEACECVVEFFFEVERVAIAFDAGPYAETTMVSV